MAILGMNRAKSAGAKETRRGGLTTALFYALALLFFTSTNSLYALQGSMRTILYLGIVLAVLVLIFLTWRTVPISRTFLRGFAIWPAFVVLAFALIGVGGSSFGGIGTGISMTLIIALPLLLHLLLQDGQLRSLLAAYCDISFLFAALSLVLWVLGPIAGVISPNCSIISTWNAQGIEMPTPGYFGLVYQTQTIDFLGGHFIRNTGIFPEAPMYSYALCIALLFSYLCGLKRPLKNAVIGITVLSTVSTTGIIVVFALVIFVLTEASSKATGGWRTLMLMAIGLLAVAIVCLVISLFNTKLDSSSGSIRFDDYRAGFLAWQNNLIFGNGLGNSDVVKQYMSGFRSYNLGFSNSPMDILARGGILFMLVFLVQIVGLFRWPSTRGKLAAGLFVFLWAVTIVTTLPITLFFFSFGTLFLMARDRPFPVQD